MVLTDSPFSVWIRCVVIGAHVSNVSSGRFIPLGLFRWHWLITPSSASGRGFSYRVFRPFLALVTTLSLAGPSSNG
jgi:hypothetical protein